MKFSIYKLAMIRHLAPMFTKSTKTNSASAASNVVTTVGKRNLFAKVYLNGLALASGYTGYLVWTSDNDSISDNIDRMKFILKLDNPVIRYVFTFHQVNRTIVDAEFFKYRPTEAVLCLLWPWYVSMYTLGYCFRKELFCSSNSNASDAE